MNPPKILRPLRNEVDLDAATKVIHSLIDQEKLSSAEQDYLDVLSDLVEAYEDVHHPIDPVPDFEMLGYLIELRNLTQAQVATGTRIAESTISEVLAGKRKLNRAQIGKLARFFRISPAAFSFSA